MFNILVWLKSVQMNCRKAHSELDGFWVKSKVELAVGHIRYEQRARIRCGWKCLLDQQHVLKSEFTASTL